MVVILDVVGVEKRTLGGRHLRYNCERVVINKIWSPCTKRACAYVDYVWPDRVIRLPFADTVLHTNCHWQARAPQTIKEPCPNGGARLTFMAYFFT